MEEQALVQLANEVLSKLPGGYRVESWREINAHVFVSLYEGLFAEALPDVIRPCKSREDEVHNIQAVIDTLSLDILNTSLSHLSGEAVVSGNKQAIKSLLEVFEWLFEYILEKIESEASSDIGGEVTLDDPDLVTPEVIDSILEKELGRSHSITREKNKSQQSKREGDSTGELIALGNNSRSLTKNSSLDKTADLIALGDSRHYRPFSTWTEGKSPISKPQKHSKSRENSHIKNTSLNSKKPATVGDLSSVLPQDSNIYNADPSQHSKLSQGVSSSKLNKDGFALERPSGSGLNRRLSSPTSNGHRWELESGPLSSDISERGYQPDQSKDFSQTPTPGQETTVDLIRESERLQKKLGLTSAENVSTSQLNNGVSGLETSLASSTAYPKPPVVGEQSGQGEFDELGLRPRSLITPTENVDSYRDTHANTLPLDPRYHSFTHHLYHHYDPKRSHTAQSLGTQVTPGRFDTMDPLQTQAETSREQGVDKSSTSYDNLKQMLQETIDMSEQAVQDSPLRGKTTAKTTGKTTRDTTTKANAKATKNTNSKSGSKSSQMTDEDLTRRLRETLQRLHSEDSATDRSVTQDTSKQSNLQGSLSDTRRQEHSQPKTQSILSPGKKNRPGSAHTKAARKVSFLTGKSDKLRSQRNQLSTRNKQRSASPDSSVSSPELESSRSYDSPPVKGPRSQAARNLHSQGNVKASRPRQKKSERPKTAAGRSTALAMDRFAETASQYFEKYYGRKPSESGEDDPYYHSDGGVQYQNNGLETSVDGDFEDFKRDLEAYKHELLRRSKQVRFDDILDDSAPGEMGGIRRKLAREEKKTRFRSEFLKDVYDRELMDFEEGMREQMSKLKSQASEIGREYRKKVKAAPATTKYTPAKKYKATKSVLLPKSKAHTRTPTGRRARKRSSTASPAASKDRLGFHDNEILPWLLEEFPFLHISSEALHNMWRKSARQIETLSKSDQYVKARKKHAQKQIEEAEYKQKLLGEIAKKELSHSERMRELDERRKQQQSVKAAIREKRLQHARIRKYYDDFSVRMRSKMLKKRTREEMVFRKLFEEGLKTQRDRIRDLRQYSRDQRDERAKKQKDELTSIENFYKDRFALLSEALDQEKEERMQANKAQQKILSQLSREFRKKTESEIETIQEELFRDEDDEYWRQMDADRLRQELHMAKYKARV